MVPSLAYQKMKSNEQLQGLIRELKKHSSSQKAPIWKRVASDLEKPTRQRRIVNLTRINRYTKENEIIVVPGKVLGTGELDHRVTIAAYNFSKQALDKIARSKGTVYSIYEFMQKNPKGQKTRIIG
jgi:large subunit ribosomal protein L18e